MALRELQFHIGEDYLEAAAQGDQGKVRDFWRALAVQLEPDQRVLAAWRTDPFGNDSEQAIQSLADLAFVLSGVHRGRCYNLRFLAQSVHDPLPPPHHERSVRPFS